MSGDRIEEETGLPAYSYLLELFGGDRENPEGIDIFVRDEILNVTMANEATEEFNRRK